VSPARMGWVRIEGPELETLTADINAQLRYPLPEGTGIRRTRLSCYPAHALLHLELPGPSGLRESYAFHAPGQLYPLDWNAGTVASFNEAALEVETPEQAAEAIRFRGWAQASTGEASLGWGHRMLVVESWDDLTFEDGVEVDPADRAAAERVMGPMTVVPAEEGDRRGSFRVSCTMAGLQVLQRAAFRVSSAGVEVLAMENDDVVPLPGLVSTRVAVDRAVVLVREVTFTARRFLRHITSGRPLHRARVTEPVQARGQTFQVPVVLRQVVFEHDVDFAGATFESGLEMNECVMEGRLLLREARVKGSLAARGLRFVPPETAPGLTPPDPWQRYDLEGQGLEVTGSLLLQGLRSRHLVTLTHADVEGDLRMGGCDIGPLRTPSLDPVWQMAVDLEVARVGGDLDLAWASGSLRRPPEAEAREMDRAVPGFSTALSVIRGSVAARRLQVGGELIFGGLRCDGFLNFQDGDFQAGVNGEATGRDTRVIALGGLSFDSARVAGSVRLGGAWVGEQLSFSNTRLGSSIFVRTSLRNGERIRPAVVKGELTLSGITASDVEFEGSDVGTLQMATGEVGRLFLQAGIEEVTERGALRAGVRPCRMGYVWLGDVSVGKAIRFIGLQVGHPDVLPPSAGEGGFVRLQNVRCGGDLEISRDWNPSFTDPPDSDEGWVGGHTPSPDGIGTWVDGPVVAVGVDVEGGLTVKNFHGLGRVEIRNCTVKQNLDCGARAWTVGAESGETTTRCRSLDLEMTRVGGDADLSGIRVEGDGVDSWVRARRLQVEGRLLFSSPRGAWDGVDGISRNPEDRFDAVIEGQLDLSVAEASHLVVSGSSFESRDSGIGISLERGRFRRLHVLEPWPFRHDLSDVRVERWQIPTEHLLTFLDRSHPFRRSSYIEIERVLRNEAQDAEADRVYRGMRRRAIQEADAARKEPGGRRGSWLGHLTRATGSRLLGWIYGWGTLYWLPMIFVALPTFLFSWGLFAQPENVEATPAALVARGIQARGGVQPGELGVPWGGADGLWMALRYHVPVVPLGARGTWEPSSGPAIAPLPGRRLPLPFSGEGYASAIFLLHWIVWPLFLYGIGRKVIRDRA
jgi:hypothetical protein